jgi:trimeric autotransporter adhesin
MTRGLVTAATRPLLGLADQRLRGLVGQRMVARPTSTEIVFTPPLDQISPASAAFSLRRIRSAYTGPAVRVRRFSDNAEADIGFTSSGNLNTFDLLAFCGISSGFDATWYDQSGNGRNLTQATQAAQPRIVNAGMVDVLGGVPALVFDAVDDFMTAASWGTISQPFSHNGVISTGASYPSFPSVVSTETGTPATTTFIETNFAALVMNAGNNGPQAAIGFNERAVFTSIYNGGSSVIAKNGTASGAVNPGSDGWAGVRLNGKAGTFAGLRFQEVVLFDSALSTTDRQLLERNQGAYYGITVA